MSPFGKYAAVVAAGAALLVLGGWVIAALHIGGIAASSQLDAAAYVVLGAIFGTAAGATTVANGAGKMGAAANTRLDAIGAPSAVAAAEIVRNPQPASALSEDITPKDA